MEERPKYTSGIYGRAEARFGGRIFIEPVQFMSPDGKLRRGLIFSEFYNGGEVGSIPQDQRTHDTQIQFIFDNIRSVEMLENALATVRELMKRDAEQTPTDQVSPELKAMLDLKIEEQDLTVRTRNILKAANIDTIGDLVRLQKTDVLKCRNAGRKFLSEIDDFLTRHNLKWGMTV